MLRGRTLSRATVLQTLFEIDTENKWDDKDFAQESLIRNSNEFLKGDEYLQSFAKQLINLVLAKRSELDKLIEKSAPEWPLDRIALVDRNILRIGLAELLFADKEQVPHKVAINEAIELAKEFGSDKSYKFVNGVLGTIYRELGEPGKDDKPDVKEEQLIGALVYHKDELGEIYLALVHDIFGYWTLVKGQKQEGETNYDAIKRKVKEEIGLEIELVEDYLGSSWYNTKKDGVKIRRNVDYFLVLAPFEDLTLKKDGGLDDANWFKLKDIKDLRFYDDILDIIEKAINILISK